MASILKVDKIRGTGLDSDTFSLDASGNLTFNKNVTVSSGKTITNSGTASGFGLSSPLGNTVTSTAEGGSGTINISQGLLKAWCKHSASAFLGTSFNYASFTDHGTGDHTGNFTSNMSETQYVFGTAGEGGTDVVRYVYLYSPATGSVRFRTAYVTHAVAPTMADLGGNGNQISGSLA
tara:strand:- start:3269 stop:3802 length:534 start_codon:yes stop_codon:yes gene_type:complete